MKNARLLIGAGCVAAGLAVGGCVERNITIASDPPGAIAYLNDVEVGRTPIKVPFTWYGDYDVRLRLERNEGTAEKPVMRRYYLHTHKVASAPPFQWMGVDLFCELTPGEYKDEKLWAFALEPVVDPSDEELTARAKALQVRLGETQELRPKEKAQKAATRPSTGPATQASTRPATRPK